MSSNFADNGDFHAIVGIFYLPQICEIEQQPFFLSEGRHPKGFFF
jgi:hypothetical protein